MRTPQPSARHCFVCGVSNPFGLKLRFYNSGPGEVTADVTIPEHFQGYPGVTHGGIVAAMLDEAAGRSHMGGDPPRFMYTARLEVSYRRNVPPGKPLRLVGRAGAGKGRKAQAAGLLYDPDGTLLAEAHALLVDIPAKVFDGVDLEELGWKVYPEEAV